MSRTAIQLQAAMEFGLRIQKASQPKLGRISTSFQVAQQLIEEWKDAPQEHLICLYLNTKNEIIQKRILFVGSLDQSIAHPREIFREAVRCSAARIIISHNHPSGNPEPSENDRRFTLRLIKCGELVGIEVLDHLIIGQSSYVSLRERGLWQQR
ncbi:DNA repair protein RadC [Enterococcus columbae DSM 7374 = ATCC 51263]|uniref:DNA repair protein RadC n=1 Tax=Enterococcus columbae DSM 7374 = ATCC 51263 TaxID=1121865 RepID=S1NEN5_9ENTE|nr:DNA repair protein RadC [Enterococcus columbae DSM 7374 = ATCC 51263]EOW84128.1 DNA repair protein RadC [Enterococcus columbae DSM 7374 = ATCC 51263]OJG23319.1 DNA repair protein RadC [Enterococcus columbae DSM 7374 = ATCC 51263]